MPPLHRYPAVRPAETLLYGSKGVFLYMSLNFNKVAFVRSASDRDHFLRDGLPQFAFAGRSNVGKSSVINRLVNRKNLAYVGASPGQTTPSK